MNKREQYLNLAGFFKTSLESTLVFYAKTEGCYIVSDDNGIVLAYRCDKDEPHKVKLEGDDLYVHYLSGDIEYLVELCADNIKHICFDHKDKFRTYNLKKLKSKIMKQSR